VAAALRVVIADDDLVVVDKPPGMPSVPARTPLDPPDVATVLAATHGPLEAVHRLDRDTSGLLVLARSREARARLGRAFEDGVVEKRYLAIVHGRLRDQTGAIHLPLADDVSERDGEGVIDGDKGGLLLFSSLASSRNRRIRNRIRLRRQQQTQLCQSKHSRAQHRSCKLHQNRCTWR
jgi:23S rRNA-/tRNA-specific pseudouridylate synthase